MPEEAVTDGEKSGLRVFLAGATGVIGLRLMPLLIAGGHTVAGMTRSAEKAGPLRELGAEPVVCDVFDADGLTAAVVAFAPDVVMHQLTDLPDRASEIAAFTARNERIRTEGTRNLIVAAEAAGAGHFLAQSIAWRTASAQVIEEHESRVLGVGGVVVRYGQLYGPGTFYETEVPPQPRIHVDAAARATPPLMLAKSGVVTVSEDAPGT
jgi:uncharacterized protein YbjT (DUF2867 family)